MTIKKNLKRTLGWMMALSMIFMLLPMITLTARAAGTPDTSWYNTVGSTFNISNADQLAGLTQLVNGGTDNFLGKFINLTANIDLSDYTGGAGWVPIGDLDWAGDLAFKGTFDGNGKIVTNLKINAGDFSAGSFIGLFGVVLGGTVKNLGIEGVNLNSVGNVVGGAIGNIKVYGIIKDCYVTGLITSTGDMIGGVVGQVESGGSIRNCWTTAMVSGHTLVGGIVGNVDSYGPIVADCAALNDSVTGAAGVGRVFGVSGNFQPLNNIAYDGMTGGDFGAIVNSGTDNNGISWTAAEVRSDGTLGGRFVNNGSPWTAANGSLPGFGTAVSMPKHLQGFGPVPSTGIPDITAYFIAMLVLIVVSVVLWVYTLRRRLITGRNG
jgi:hypothetical protein